MNARFKGLRGFPGGAKAEGLWAAPIDGGVSKDAGTYTDKSELVTTQAVEPWPEPVDGATLLEELAEVFRRFVRLPKHGPETLALWVVHTYGFQLREVSTYIGVESPEKRCGKTTLLSLLGELVHRPVAAANISSPAFFRVIEEIRPTLIIDEADTFLKTNDELRGILNSGYSRKTAFVVRVGQKKETRLLRYSCWCPKVMACIGRLPDTLADRCITLHMERKLAGEECERLRDLRAGGLRSKCARFVQDHLEAIASGTPLAPDGLNDRAADIWEPLLVLADIAGAGWDKRAREAAVALTAAAQGPTPGGALLLDIFAAFTIKGADRMFSRDLVDLLNGWTDRPWADARQGRPVTNLWLAAQLRDYGIRPRNLRTASKVAKGYVLDDMREVFKRYITDADLKERTECVLHAEGDEQKKHEGGNLKNQT